MIKVCQNCQKHFEVTDEDLNFYDKVSPVFNGKKFNIPSPNLCPDCRQQRRLSYRNERHLYHGKCALTGENIITMYSSDKPYKVFKQSVWWSDSWDPLSYGRNFDFNRSFFNQFYDLQLKVPRPALYSKNAENSRYTNHCDSAKNCYMCVDTGFSEDIFFSKWMIDCKDCIDSYQLEKCELCHESLYCVSSYNCIHILFSDNCSNSSFLYDCNSCEYCFMCTHLRNKKYHIRNVEYTKEEYFKYLKDYPISSNNNFSQYVAEYKEMISKTFHKNLEMINCVNSHGDCLCNCKNVKDSFDVIESEDCKYCYDAGHMKDCYDAYEPAFDCELQYDCHACNRTKSSLFCNVCYDNYGLIYCDNCHNCNNCFGCVGLRHKEYCILNKQYSKDEYEALVSKIIEYMQGINEFGEFFPVEYGLFAYNESTANEYYPMTKEEVIQKNWKWRDIDKSQYHQTEEYVIPDDISDVNQDICNKVLNCEVTGKPYKIISQELQLYKKMNLPIPRKCPDQRYFERMSLRNPRKMWIRKCDKCGKDIYTTYNPENGGIVYCQKCYLKTVY